MSNNKVTLRDVYSLSERMDKKLDDMSKRVSSLEIWKAGIQAKIALGVGILTIVFYTTADYVKHKVFKQ